MRIILSFLGVLFLTGCMSVSYVPYNQEVYPKKLKDSPLILGSSLLAKRQFTNIGLLTVRGGSLGSSYTSMQDVEKKFFGESRKKGADGIVSIKINSAPYAYESYIPGYTSHKRVTTSHFGNVFGNTSGSGSYSGYYSGISTTNVPVYHPGYTIDYSGVIHSMSGELIVLLENTLKDIVTELEISN